MIAEHTAAVIIQTHFQVFHQHRTLQDNSDHGKEARHFDKMQHLDQLIHSFNSDLTAITTKFHRITQPTHDICIDTNIACPQHSPDPVVQPNRAVHNIICPQHGPDPTITLDTNATNKIWKTNASPVAMMTETLKIPTPYPITTQT
eukprot:8456500-Ditylum_brightwellii.AAC.2